MWIVIFFLSLVAAVAYRAGGSSEFNTKVRDMGVPLVALSIMIIMGVSVEWWVHLIAYVLMFGSLTTYCKIGEQEDVHWYNWAMTGALYGLSAIPYAIATGNWNGFILRIVMLSIATMLWSEAIDEVNAEESGRGFLFTITLPLLLI